MRYDTGPLDQNLNEESPKNKSKDTGPAYATKPKLPLKQKKPLIKDR